MRILEFSPESLKDLAALKDYISNQFGEKSSIENLSKVMDGIETLKQFPYQGASILERYGISSDYRYLFIHKNYVFYRVENDILKIIRVLDERRNFLQILFGGKK